jgi:hypothetical protein
MFLILAGALLLSLLIPVPSKAQVPTQGLRLWLKADAGITKGTDGKVTRWADQSGNGKHATAAAGKGPVYVAKAANGMPALRFNEDLNLAGDMGTIPAPMTIFTYVRFDADYTHAQYVFSSGDRSNDGGWGYGNHVSISREGTGYYCMWGYPSGEPGHLRVWGVLPGDQDLVITTAYRSISSSPNHRLWVSGTAKTAPEYTLPSGKNFSNRGQYAIGRWIKSSYPWWLHGEVSEILVYNQECTETLRLAVEQYLLQKYVLSQRLLEMTITPGGGVAVLKRRVRLINEMDYGMIYYTTDGSDPTPSDILYTDPFYVDKTTVISARAFLGTEPVTDVAREIFIIAGENGFKVEYPAADLDLTGYVHDTSLGGRVIMLPTGTGSGTAALTFPEATGTYAITLVAMPENDGNPTVQVYVNSTLVIEGTYPSDPNFLTGVERKYFSVLGVAIKQGDGILIKGTADGGAMARVEKIIFTQENPTRVSGDINARASGNMEGAVPHTINNIHYFDILGRSVNSKNPGRKILSSGVYIYYSNTATQTTYKKLKLQYNE